MSDLVDMWASEPSKKSALVHVEYPLRTATGSHMIRVEGDTNKGALLDAARRWIRLNVQLKPGQFAIVYKVQPGGHKRRIGFINPPTPKD